MDQPTAGTVAASGRSREGSDRNRTAPAWNCSPRFISPVLCFLSSGKSHCYCRCSGLGFVFDGPWAGLVNEPYVVARSSSSSCQRSFPPNSKKDGEGFLHGCPWPLPGPRLGIAASRVPTGKGRGALWRQEIIGRRGLRPEGERRVRWLSFFLFPEGDGIGDAGGEAGAAGAPGDRPCRHGLLLRSRYAIILASPSPTPPMTNRSSTEKWPFALL